MKLKPNRKWGTYPILCFLAEPYLFVGFIHFSNSPTAVFPDNCSAWGDNCLWPKGKEMEDRSDKCLLWRIWIKSNLVFQAFIHVSGEKKKENIFLLITDSWFPPEVTDWIISIIRLCIVLLCSWNCLASFPLVKEHYSQLSMAPLSARPPFWGILVFLWMSECWKGLREDFEHIRAVGWLGTAQVTGTRGLCYSQAEQALGRQRAKPLRSCRHWGELKQDVVALSFAHTLFCRVANQLYTNNSSL